MFIKLKKVIISSDITGMILAPILDAVFIPVSFLESFAWEYIDFDVPLIQYIKDYFYVRSTQFENDNDRSEQYKIYTQKQVIQPKLFYWEIERFYKMYLLHSSLIYDDFTFDKVFVQNKTLYFHSKSGLALTVGYDICYVVNPGDHYYINHEIQAYETVSSATAHLLYYLNIRTDTADAKGIQHPYDIHEYDVPPITKIWYSKPFGPKKYQTGYDPKKKKKIITTRDLTFFCENIPIENINNEEFEISQIRKSIFNSLTEHKRIVERPVSFEKDIKKFILSTNLDMFKDTDHEKFIYFNDKSEIVCQNNLKQPYSQQSSQHILHSTMNKTIGSLLTNTLRKKIMF